MIQLPTASSLFTFYTSLVTICSFVLRFILPPSDKFNDWPRFQGYYKFFLVIIGWIAWNKTNGNGGTNGSQVPLPSPTPITSGK